MAPDRELTKKYLAELKQLIYHRQNTLASFLLGVGCLSVFAGGAGAVCGSLAGYFMPPPLNWWIIGGILLAAGVGGVAVALRSSAAATDPTKPPEESSPLGCALLAILPFVISFPLYAWALNWPQVNQDDNSRAVWGGSVFAAGFIVSFWMMMAYWELTKEPAPAQPDKLPEKLWGVEVDLDEAPSAAAIAACHLAMHEMMKISYFDLGALADDGGVIAIGGETEMQALVARLGFLNLGENMVYMTSLDKPAS